MVYHSIVVKRVRDRNGGTLKVTMGEQRLSYALHLCNGSFTSSDRSGTNLFRHVQHMSLCIFWYVGILYQLIVHVHAGMNCPWSLWQVISENSKRQKKVGCTSSHMSRSEKERMGARRRKILGWIDLAKEVK